MTLTHYMVLGSLLFCIGVFGALTRKNAIAILISLELVFNGVNLNLVAISRFNTPIAMQGQMWTLFIIAVAAAESVLGLAIILAIYKRRKTVNADGMNLMKG